MTKKLNQYNTFSEVPIDLQFEIVINTLANLEKLGEGVRTEILRKACVEDNKWKKGFVITPEELRSVLSDVEELGLVFRLGKTRGTYWYLN